MLGVRMLLFWIWFSNCASSAAQSINPKYQSVFIYGITRKIQWTSDADKFRIGVVGRNKGLLTELNDLSPRKVGLRTIEVEEIDGLGNLSHDIIFISGRSKSELDTYLSSVSSNTLVMTEFDGAIEAGAHINFIMNGDKIAFELNETALNSTSLRVSNDLIRLAARVQ